MPADVSHVVIQGVDDAVGSGGAPGGGPIVGEALAQVNPGASELPRVELADALASRGRDDVIPGDLAEVHAVLRDEQTRVPLRNAPCFVTDRNGVVVPGTTDEFGVLRTVGRVLKGEVTLRYAAPEARYHMERGASPEDLANGVKREHPLWGSENTVSLHRVHKLQHSAHPDVPDVWGVSVDFVVAIELSDLASVSATDVHVTLASSDGELGPAPVLPPKYRPFDQPDWIATSTLQHLVFEVGRGSVRHSSPLWSKARITEHAPGRALRIVKFTEDQLYFAEVKVPVVRPWTGGAIQVTFREMVETDPAVIRTLFARQTAYKINSWNERRHRQQETAKLQVASVRGVMSSRTGSYHQRVRVIARPVKLLARDSVPNPSGTAQVVWEESEGGRWTGNFEIPNLAATHYVLKFKLDGDAFLESNRVEAVAPREFLDGELVVLDDRPTYPIALEVHEADGGLAFGYTATLTSSPGGSLREASVVAAHAPPGGYPQPTKPETVVLPFRLTDDATFTVKIETLDRRTETIRSERFHFDGERWIAKVTLAPPVDK